MRFKLDENFGSRTQQLFRQAGYDVDTVREEGLQGKPDSDIFAVCLTEQRCLVTLDLDFSNVTQFPPSHSNGIVVIRVARNPSLPLLERLVSDFLRFLLVRPIGNELWIVEVGKIRIHQSDDERGEA